MSKLEIDLPEIALALIRHSVDFVVVGGMAVVLHGGETTTLDVDLAFSRSTANIERLASALQELSAKPKRWSTDSYRLSPADLVSKWLHLESDFGDIDLIAEMPDFAYDSLKENAEQFDLGEAKIWVASIAELIEIKSRAARGKDLVHVAELKDILRIRAEQDPHSNSEG